MAMDDTYRLVQAVLIDCRMTRPSKYNAKNIPVGPWIEAEIVRATVSGEHTSGVFNGFVWYRIKGDKYAKDATFHALWLEGWTSFEYRDQVRTRLKRAK